jgi:hypothetical protein
MDSFSVEVYGLEAGIFHHHLSWSHTCLLIFSNNNYKL